MKCLMASMALLVGCGGCARTELVKAQVDSEVEDAGLGDLYADNAARCVEAEFLSSGPWILDLRPCSQRSQTRLFKWDSPFEPVDGGYVSRMAGVRLWDHFFSLVTGDDASHGLARLVFAAEDESWAELLRFPDADFRPGSAAPSPTLDAFFSVQELTDSSCRVDGGGASLVLHVEAGGLRLGSDLSLEYYVPPPDRLARVDRVLRKPLPRGKRVVLRTTTGEFIFCGRF